MKKYDGITMNLADRSNWVAIIGSRKARPEELRMARLFAQKCAQMGKVVVSGAALGIDTEAHKGAMEAGGKTIAVVNTPPFQSIYPAQSRELAESIKKQGGIMYPFQTKADENEGNGLNHFSKRLIERDLLVAHMCPVIIVVSDNDVISGGTRWATAYGKEWNKKVQRLDSQGRLFENPATAEAKFSWKMELTLK